MTVRPTGACQLLLLLLATSDLLAAVGCIVMSGLHVPEHVLEGGTARLLCNFRLLAGERLYSLKWYKSDQEFFRLLPDGRPQIKAFPIPGVNLDVYQLDKHGVVLKLSKVDWETSGRYTCEVSAEAPHFDTKTAYGDLLVVVLPKQGPVISGGKSVYRVGDTVNVTCTAGPSNPPPNVTWLINDRPADDSYLTVGRGQLSDGDGGGGESCCTSVSVRLEFTIGEDDFGGDEGGVRLMRLKCLATVEAAHWTPAGQQQEGEWETTVEEDVQESSGNIAPSANPLLICFAALMANSLFCRTVVKFCF